MNPWKDRPKNPVDVETEHPAICPDYPACAKEERRLLSEVRESAKSAPTTFTLSNGLRAVDFCLHFIIKNHFKRKIGKPS
jgi:hypothetical protein